VTGTISKSMCLVTASIIFLHNLQLVSATILAKLVSQLPLPLRLLAQSLGQAAWLGFIQLCQAKTILAISRDQQIFGDPEQFDPSIWLDNESTARSPSRPVAKARPVVSR
jgi:hypothetical protein